MKDNILWSPSPTQVATTEATVFMKMLLRKGIVVNDFTGLYNWSIQDTPAFWSYYWDFAGIIGSKGETTLINGSDIEKAVWFPHAKLNYAENLLSHLLEKPDSDKIAIYFKSEDKKSYSLSNKALMSQVSAIAQWLKSQGVIKGDRVAAYMGNTPETIVAMLATTSLGAVWTSTSPDFGAQSVIERFGQTKPKILFTQDGYFYNGKEVDIREKVKEIDVAIGSIQAVVNTSFLGLAVNPNYLQWISLANSISTESLTFEPCNFNDPLFIGLRSLVKTMHFSARL